MTMVEVMFGFKKPLLLQETFAFARKAKGQKGQRAKGQQGPVFVFLI